MIKGKAENSNIQMSLFEINQQLISQFNDFTDEDWIEAVEKIDKWHNEIKSDYYMMLCKEISYYTVFINGDYSHSSLGEMVRECLAFVGNVLTIDYSNKDCLDIWVRIDEKTQCLHLFNYTRGVVDFKG